MPLTPRDGLALAAAAVAAVALGAAAWITFAAGAGGPADPIAGSPFGTALAAPGSAGADPPSAAAPASELLVDVQGAVARPGLVRLAPAARVADAIVAAGGYSDVADLLAAASTLNLAAPLSDGGQLFVPIQGVAAGGGSAGAGPGAGGGGLVNLNTASPEQLDALPQIGPVTVQKIVAARQERPFATLDELIEREVMNRGQLEAIRDLVTL